MSEHRLYLPVGNKISIFVEASNHESGFSTGYVIKKKGIKPIKLSVQVVNFKP